MQLPLQTFTSLVESMAAAVQGACRQLVDLTVGSALRAVLEANASLALWIQWLTLQVLQTTRAATSQGADLDSWMADFSLSRLPAAAATGFVTFSRFTPVGTALVPAGSQVRTADGTQTFAVQADPASAAWNAALGGYVLPDGAASISVPVTALAPGTAGNVQGGTITLMASAIPGIDTVSNPGSIQGGLDAEGDAALRARFQNFIDSRSRATPVAVGYAISSLQQGLQYTIAENVDESGAPLMGHFVITVDDGTGSPSAGLLANVREAVDVVRPLGSTFSVRAPTVVLADVTLSIDVTPGAQKSQMIGPVADAITTWINALPIGTPLPLSRISQLAYSVSPDVTNVSQVALNGEQADITPAASAVVKAGTVAVN